MDLLRKSQLAILPATSQLSNLSSGKSANLLAHNNHLLTPRPESTVSATEASTYATSANVQSHLSQHQNGQSQRSRQPQPESTGPESKVRATEARTKVRATEARTSKTRAKDQSHHSQYHIRTPTTWATAARARTVKANGRYRGLQRAVSTRENTSITCTIR